MDRVITGTIYKFDGTPWSGVNITLTLLTDPAANPGTMHPLWAKTIQTEEDGSIPEGTTLATPDSGAWLYRIKVENNAALQFHLEAGDTLAIDELLALAGAVGSEAGTPQQEWLNLVYGGLDEADAGQVLTADGVGSAGWEDVGGGGIPEPASDGVWARFRASGVGSWLQATAVGAALFAAVDAAAARATIGAVADDDLRLSDARTPTAHAVTHMTAGSDPLAAGDIGAIPLISSAVAGNLVAQLEDGTLVNTELGLLSDYSGVIVVDAAGRGDYASLRDAITAAPDGSLIFVFGEVNDAGARLVFDKRLTLIGFGQDINIALGPSPTHLFDVWNCNLGSYIGHGINGVNLALHNVNAAHVEALSGTIVSHGGSITQLTSLGNADVVAHNTDIGTLYFEDLFQPSLILYACRVDTLSLVSYDGIYWPSAQIIACSIGTCAVTNTPGWIDAPFYHCQFASSFTGMTLEAGNHSNTVGGATYPAVAALGENVFTGNQNLNGNQIYGYSVREVIDSISGTYTINLLSGTLFVLTITGNVAIDFGNVPATPGASSVTVIVVQGGAGGYTVTFTGAKWANGTAPTLDVPSGQETHLTFILRDLGNEVYGYLAAEDVK